MLRNSFFPLDQHLQWAKHFLAEMSKEIDQDVQIVLIWDATGYHRSGKRKMRGNITPITLPPYSPKLNPIENLWQYLRSPHWLNFKYDNYNALRQAGCDAWQATSLDAEVIKSVCRVGYLKYRRFKTGPISHTFAGPQHVEQAAQVHSS